MTQPQSVWFAVDADGSEWAYKSTPTRLIKRFVCDGNDQINGYPTTGSGYTYWTYAGTKTINGGNGDDFIYGANGADSLIGGSGNDSIYGSTGNDTIDGGTGNDSLFGGEGTDSLLA